MNTPIIRSLTVHGLLSQQHSINGQSPVLAVHIATPTRATTPMLTAMGTATIADSNLTISGCTVSGTGDTHSWLMMYGTLSIIDNSEVTVYGLGSTSLMRDKLYIHDSTVHVSDKVYFYEITIDNSNLTADDGIDCIHTFTYKPHMLTITNGSIVNVPEGGVRALDVEVSANSSLTCNGTSGTALYVTDIGNDSAYGRLTIKGGSTVTTTTSSSSIYDYGFKINGLFMSGDSYLIGSSQNHEDGAGAIGYSYGNEYGRVYFRFNHEGTFAYLEEGVSLENIPNSYIEVRDTLPTT